MDLSTYTDAVAAGVDPDVLRDRVDEALAGEET